MAAMKRLALAAVAASFFLPATAHAAVPCRDRIYNDWYKDGKIASTYPVACYRDALKHVPADARTYSSLADDIRAAEQAAIARAHGKTVPEQIGKGGTGSVTPATATVPAETTPGETTQGNDGVTDETTTTASGAVVVKAASSSGGGIPLPILVLGGIAIALVAIGAVGTGVRRFRRPGPPPPAS
jgi:hypothetical protein